MYLDVNQTTNQLVKKEGAVRLDFLWIKPIARIGFIILQDIFENITRNTRVCIKHFEEKDVHTFDLHTNYDGSTYRVSYVI